MKKISALFLVMVLLAGLLCPVFAAGPAKPEITGNAPYNYRDVGDEVYLFVDAKSTDGGTLTYQWYSTTVDDITTIRAVDGATSKEYLYKATKGGITYYCCAVWNNVGGVQSEPVYSRFIRVWISPLDPVIDSTGPDVHMKVGSETGVWCQATVGEQGTLTYQWYKTNVNDITTIRAIDGATSSDLDLKQDYAEVAYYCCAVWNNINGKQSDPVYSRLIRVEFFDPESDPPEQETVQALEIMEMPDKLEYQDGEPLDLKGLKVRVFTDLGFFDLNDGEKLNATQPDYSKSGTQIITISYEGVSETFEITVKAKEVPAPDPNQNTASDPNQNTAPDPGQNTVPDPNQNTAPDPNQNTVPDPNQNTVPEPNNGGEKKPAGFVPYVCAAAGLIVGGLAVFLIMRRKK